MNFAKLRGVQFFSVFVFFKDDEGHPDSVSGEVKVNCDAGINKLGENIWIESCDGGFANGLDRFGPVEYCFPISHNGINYYFDTFDGFAPNKSDLGKLRVACKYLVIRLRNGWIISSLLKWKASNNKSLDERLDERVDGFRNFLNISVNDCFITGMDGDGGPRLEKICNILDVARSAIIGLDSDVGDDMGRLS